MNLGFYSRMIMDFYFPERFCWTCGKKERIEIHHKNHKWWDLRLDNMEYRCIYCHKKHHQPLNGKKGGLTRKKLFRAGKLKVWNKGLTKNNNKILQRVSRKTSATRLKLFAEGKMKRIGKHKFIKIGVDKMEKKKAFGGYSVCFRGRKETMEQVFGNKEIAPSLMTKKLWAFVKENNLGGK